jgi:hypothetical protein
MPVAAAERHVSGRICRKIYRAATNLRRRTRGECRWMMGVECAFECRPSDRETKRIGVPSETGLKPVAKYLASACHFVEKVSAAADEQSEQCRTHSHGDIHGNLLDQSVRYRTM